jgi:hypothetical protein
MKLLSILENENDIYSVIVTNLDDDSVQGTARGPRKDLLSVVRYHIESMEDTIRDAGGEPVVSGEGRDTWKIQERTSDGRVVDWQMITLERE